MTTVEAAVSSPRFKETRLRLGFSLKKVPFPNALL